MAFVFVLLLAVLLRQRELMGAALTLEWGQSSGVVDGYKILRFNGVDFSEIATTEANILSFRDSNLSPSVKPIKSRCLQKVPDIGINVDGTPVFSLTDPTFNGGTVALYSWANAGSLFDEVLVEDLATGDVLLWDNFDDGVVTGWTVVDAATTGVPVGLGGHGRHPRAK